MILLTRPSDEQIRNVLAVQSRLPFTYDEVGASDGTPPDGYNVERTRARLGSGEEVFSRGAAAIRGWEQFPTGWMQLCWPSVPLEPGATVGILVGMLGIWSLSVCRVVFLIDEDGPVRRFGFGYGTLPEHIARGEERFVVEWHRADDSVWYDIVAFSRPNSLLFWAGYPLARQFQKYFARQSAQAMLRRVGAARRDLPSPSSPSS